MYEIILPSIDICYEIFFCSHLQLIWLLTLRKRLYRPKRSMLKKQHSTWRAKQRNLSQCSYKCSQKWSSIWRYGTCSEQASWTTSYHVLFNDALGHTKRVSGTEASLEAAARWAEKNAWRREKCIVNLKRILYIYNCVTFLRKTRKQRTKTVPVIIMIMMEMIVTVTVTLIWN